MMETISRFIVLVCAVTIMHSTVYGEVIDNTVTVSNVKRTIDISTQLVKVIDDITVESSDQSVEFFLFAIDSVLDNNLAYITAEPKDAKKPVDEDEEESSKLDVVEAKVQGHSDKTFYKISLPSRSKKASIKVDHVYAHALEPHPSHISQSEKQLVRFTGNAFMYSPYIVSKQQTVIKLASDKVESHTTVKPSTKRDNQIIYGPYENKPAFSQEEISVHYENNSPFLRVSHLERVIEVSHWGNIAVEETVDIVHQGAILKGSFSRYEYQRDPNSGLSSVKSYKTVLPASARDVYYRDEIGNISTSHLREYDDYIEVELRPRFPLFGGWKTHYVLGYNLPSYEYLFNSGDDYVLKMRFIDHIYDDAIIDQATIKVILPEGSKGADFKSSYPVQRGPDESIATYLDTVGRPVVVLHKENLVEQHIQDFELQYSFRKLLMLREPLLVVGAFMVLFITVIIYVRLDFSISKDAHSESKMRIAGYVEQVQSVQDRRSATYQSYEDAINKFKQSKDNGRFQADKKKVDADYKQLTHTLTDLLTKLKQEGADITDKVSEVQKLDRLIKEQIGQSISHAEKLISGKMNKQQYIDMEKSCAHKRADMLMKIDSIMSTI